MVKSDKLLHPLGDTHLRTEFGCDLLTQQKQPAFPSRAKVDDWLMGISAARTRYGARAALCKDPLCGCPCRESPSRCPNRRYRFRARQGRLGAH